MWGRGAFTVATQQQLFRDPAVVIKYFTSVEAVGKGRDTVWKLKLDTRFGQTYSFELASTGVITQMWKTTAAPEELLPLRQFYRGGPVSPGK